MAEHFVSQLKHFGGLYEDHVNEKELQLSIFLPSEIVLGWNSLPKYLYS